MSSAQAKQLIVANLNVGLSTAMKTIIVDDVCNDTSEENQGFQLNYTMLQQAITAGDDMNAIIYNTIACTRTIKNKLST